MSQENNFFVTAIDIVGSTIMRSCADDYAHSIWWAIRDDVIADITECTDGDDGFTHGDISLAIGRVLTKRLGIENDEPIGRIRYECS